MKKHLDKYLLGAFAMALVISAIGATITNISMVDGVCTQLIQFYNTGNWFYGHGDRLNFPVPSAAGNLAKLDIAGRIYDGGPPAAGTGDTVAPASNTDGYVPQWNGADSKTLKDGLAVGTGANNLLQLDGSAKIPAVDGSQLTNLPSSGGVNWNYVTATATTMAANQGYLFYYAGEQDATFPAGPTLGDLVAMRVLDAAGQAVWLYGGGSNIEGSADPLEINTSKFWAEWIYVNSEYGWVRTK